MPSFRPLHRATSVPLDRDNRSTRRTISREEMRKKLMRRNTLPEIQEEGLLTPLRCGAAYSGHGVQPQDPKRSRDLEAGADTPHHQLNSNVEMAAALVDQVISHTEHQGRLVKSRSCHSIMLTFGSSLRYHVFLRLFLVINISVTEEVWKSFKL